MNQKYNKKVILDLKFAVDMATYSSIADPKLVAQPKVTQNTLFWWFEVILDGCNLGLNLLEDDQKSADHSKYR